MKYLVLMTKERTNHTITTISVAFGFTSYLLFSFIVGFISISVGWLLNFSSEIVALIMAVIPVLLFVLTQNFIEKMPKLLLLSIVTWILAAISPVVELKYILIIAGVFVTLSSFKFLLKLYVHNCHEFSSRIFVLTFITVDQVLKFVNQGQIPIIHVSIFALVPVLLFSILAFLYLFEINFLVHSNNNIITQISSQEAVEESETARPKPYGIFGFYFSIFLYFFLFSSIGPIAYNLNLFFDNAYLYGHILVIFILLSYYFLRPKNLFTQAKTDVLIRMTSFVLLITIFFYPWFTIQLIFWFIGLGTLILLLDYSVNAVKYTKDNHIIIVLTLCYLLMITFVFVLLITEKTLIYGLVGLIVAISSIYAMSSFDIRLRPLLFKSYQPSTFIRNFKFPLSLNRQALLLIVLVLISVPLALAPILQPHSTQVPNSSLKAMTYNLHFGTDSHGFDNSDRVRDFVLKENPSFIAFQEVTFNSPMNGYKNIFNTLKTNLGSSYPYIYYSERQTGALSNAFFSHYPIVNASTITLAPIARYQRNMLNIVVDINGVLVRVVALHLTHVIEKESNPDRVKQAQFVIDQISNLQELPTIILGDFNSWPEFLEAKIFSRNYVDGWNSTNPTLPGPTWPSLSPEQRIDYIYFSASFKVNNCMVGNTLASDHRPLTCEFEM